MFNFFLVSFNEKTSSVTKQNGGKLENEKKKRVIYL